MALRAMSCERAELPFVGCPAMSGHQLLTMEDLYAVCRQAHLDRLADQLVRHRVVGALDLDVIIEMNLGLLPGGELVARERQCAQGGALDLGEQAGARAFAALEGACV